jgi:hypothetical protein
MPIAAAKGIIVAGLRAAQHKTDEAALADLAAKGLLKPSP